MLEILRKKNPNLNIESVFDESFQLYGKSISVDVSEVLNFGDSQIDEIYEVPFYQPSVPEIERMAAISKINQLVFGGTELMVGIVAGKGTVFNGLEYHNCSEVLIAVTDFVYVAAHRWDMKNNFVNTDQCKCFYVPCGTVIEGYATTLHYSLLQANENMYKAICILPRGTGDVLPDGPFGILKRKNKWFISHPSNTLKIVAGDFPGFIGDIIKINL